MKDCKGLPTVLLVFALGCGDRSALDVFGIAPVSRAGGSIDGGGTGSSSSGSSGGMAPSGSGPSGSSGGASGSGGSNSGGSGSGGSQPGGIELTCTGSTTCMRGLVCCATVNLSAGLSVSSACQAAPCASGAYQFCASSSECSGGATCEPNPLGMGPMICTGGGGTSGSSGSSSGGGTGADAAFACSTPDTTRCGPDNYFVLPLTGDPVACGLSVPSPPESLCTALCHPSLPQTVTCSLQQDAGANEVVCNCVTGPQ